jgi:hypothetical protein
MEDAHALLLPKLFLKKNKNGPEQINWCLKLHPQLARHVLKVVDVREQTLINRTFDHFILKLIGVQSLL